MIEEVRNEKEKRRICRLVLEQLQDWFEIEEAREAYIANAGKQVFFAAKEEGEPVGFLCLHPTSHSTMEIVVMGVLPSHQGKGYGTALLAKAKEYCKQHAYTFLQVKTVAMGHYAIYDKTNRFYQSVGFQELEVFPTLWDENNPCQIYVMHIGG